MSDIVERLRNPPFGTETSERNLMEAAANAIEARDAEIARLRAVLLSYANLFCESSQYDEGCGKYDAFSCSGYTARAALKDNVP